MQEPAAYDAYGAQAQPGYSQGYQQPSYGAAGYPVPGQEQQQQQFNQPPYGQQPAVGGYQPLDQGYPPPAQPSMDDINRGVRDMGFGGSPQPPPQQQAQNRPHLNQLYPTDMLNQPFQVSELDLDPPPMVLPPNVRRLIPVSGCRLTRLDERYCFTSCELPTEICSFYAKCCTDYEFSSQKITFTFRARCTALFLAT